MTAKGEGREDSWEAAVSEMLRAGYRSSKAQGGAVQKGRPSHGPK